MSWEIWDVAVVTLIGAACLWLVVRRVRRFLDRAGGPCCGCPQARKCAKEDRL